MIMYRLQLSECFVYGSSNKDDFIHAVNELRSALEAGMKPQVLRFRITTGRDSLGSYHKAELTETGFVRYWYNDPEYGLERLKLDIADRINPFGLQAEFVEEGE